MSHDWLKLTSHISVSLPPFSTMMFNDDFYRIHDDDSDGESLLSSSSSPPLNMMIMMVQLLIFKEPSSLDPHLKSSHVTMGYYV